MRKSTFTAFVDFSKVYDRVDRRLLWSKLGSIGLGDKMMQALKQIFNKVECGVKVNSVKHNWFSVNARLKQGCIISPLLFNLFVNDLATEIKNSVKSLNIGDELVALLLFADDLVVLCESEEDLQAVLDIIHKWCNQWKMSVNIDKTKVVHFSSPSMSATQHVFTCGSNTIEVVDHHKYLGLILTDTLDYNGYCFYGS